MKKKGDKNDSAFDHLKDLIELAYKIREQCSAASVGRTDCNGVISPVPGHDTRSMDWQLDLHSVTGAFVAAIGDMYGEGMAHKVHMVYAEDGKKSSLSPKQRHELKTLFTPALWNLLDECDLLKDIHGIYSNMVENVGIDRFQVQAGELERAYATASPEGAGLGIKDFTGKDADEDSAKLYYAMLALARRNHKIMP